MFPAAGPAGSGAPPCGPARWNIIQGSDRMFCPNCGSELLAGAKFCASCGNPVSAISSNMDQTETEELKNYIITIKRASQFYVINPAINLTLDDRESYKIANGETIRISVPSGEHTLTFSSGIRNKVVRVNVTGDFSLAVHWNRVTGSLIVE